MRELFPSNGARVFWVRAKGLCLAAGSIEDVRSAISGLLSACNQTSQPSAESSGALIPAS